MDEQEERFMRIGLKVTFVIFVILMALIIGQAIAARASSDGKVSVRIPTCQEDEIFLKGKGDFDGERWSRYVCIHPDNL